MRKQRFPPASISYAHYDRAIFLHRPILGVACCILSGIEIREIILHLLKCPYYLYDRCSGIFCYLIECKIKTRTEFWHPVCEIDIFRENLQNLKLLMCSLHNKTYPALFITTIENIGTNT